MLFDLPLNSGGSASQDGETSDVWMKTAGFEQVQTKPVGWLNQVTQGIKPKKFTFFRETT